MNNKLNQPLEETVLATIKATGLCPRSKWWYRFSNLLLWSSIGSTIIVGALAVSVLMYAGLHGWFGLYELVGMSWFGYLALRLTLVWPLIFLITIGLAYLNVRCTRRGYRWSVRRVVGTSLITSVLLGVGLHLAGAGYVTDTLLAKHIPMYPAQDRIEYALWHQPEAGRIIGAVTTHSSTTADFAAIDGGAWEIDMSMLSEAEVATLVTGKRVHVVGTTTSDAVLRGCAVVSPMLMASTTHTQLAAERAKRAELKDAVTNCM